MSSNRHPHQALRLFEAHRRGRGLDPALEALSAWAQLTAGRFHSASCFSAGRCRPACPFFGSRVVFRRADEPLAQPRGRQAASRVVLLRPLFWVLLLHEFFSVRAVVLEVPSALALGLPALS
jgi:hypothetical protein